MKDLKQQLDSHIATNKTKVSEKIKDLEDELKETRDKIDYKTEREGNQRKT